MLKTGMKCLIEGCHNGVAENMRGLCMKCYSDAKGLVDSGKTSWEDLEQMGLAFQPISKFRAAFNKKKEVR